MGCFNCGQTKHLVSVSIGSTRYVVCKDRSCRSFLQKQFKEALDQAFLDEANFGHGEVA